MNQQLTTKIVNYLQSQPIDKAWLFGSYSRNEETKNSDIDLLVTFSSKEKITLFKYVHIVNDLEELTGCNVDMVEEGQLKSFAVETVNADKKLIYERIN